MIVKLLSAETDLTSDSNVSSATLVRVYNGGSATLLIRKNSVGDTIGSCTIAAGEVIVVEKDSTDLLSSAGGSSVKVSKIAFSN